VSCWIVNFVERRWIGMEFRIKLSKEDIETLKSDDLGSQAHLMEDIANQLEKDYDEGNYISEEV